MTERNDAITTPKTLVGLGPPDPPESLEVPLEKTDAKDAPVETVRAWAASGGGDDVFTESTLHDLDARFLLGDELARRRRAFVTAGALACAAMFALTFTLGRAPASVPSPRVAAKAAPKNAILVGGPWVLRATEGTPEEAPNAEPPAYLFRTADSPAPRHAPSARAHRPVAMTNNVVESAPTQTEDPSGVPAENAGRIQAVADAVKLEEDEDTTAPAAGAAP